MTKEKLEKEAREYLAEHSKYSEVFGEFFVAVDTLTAMLDFAEPREKRIAELEAQIEKMKCWCNCKNYLSCLEECCRKNISFEKGICYNCKKWELRR